MFLVLVCVLVGVVSASVEVHNYSIEKEYALRDLIKGEINLTIVDEEFGSYVTSNNDDVIGLGDFLDKNWADYYCSPLDCSDGYEVLESGDEMTFFVPVSDVVYGGFVLNGENVEVTGISFDISSDFVVSSVLPIEIDFFEGSEWEWGEFSSDEFSLDNWGCYNHLIPVVGPPIRKSIYCEMITVSDTNALYVGAVVDEGDTVDLKMSIYPELGGNDLGNCLFNPGTDEGCVIEAGLDEIFSGGDYQVCVSKPDSLDSTNYNLFQESEGEICGFVYSMGPGTGSSDYGIFAREAKYTGSENFGSGDFDFASLVSAADSLVESKYGRNCSDSCVLPFVISGISQNVVVSNVVVDYFNNGIDAYVEESSSLNVLPATVGFSGVLDLEMLGFNVTGGMLYRLLLGDVELLEEEIDIFPVPIVISVSPLNPPAGVPVEFRALVQFDTNGSLSYIWDFGDESSPVSTNGPSVVHTYGELGNYSMSVEVSAGGNMTSERVFSIEAISPEVAVSETLYIKRKNLDGVISVLGGLPSWYSGILSGIIDVVFLDSELDRLDDARNATSGAGDYISIAEDLYALDVPVGLVFDSYSAPDLLTDMGDIDAGIIAEVGGAGSGSDEDYKNPIFVWQNTYINAGVSSRAFAVLKDNGEKEIIFNVYDIDISSSGVESSYFVINKDRDDLFFKESVGESRVGEATVIDLGSGDSKSVSFYYEGSDGVSFFVSPKLSSLVIDSDIDASCNFNFICEEGEDYKSCRSDCKPIGWAIFYGVLVLIGFLFVWGLLQFWYKRMYEGHLFKDRRQLYNLLMYVTNAGARGVGDLRMRSELRSKGWSRERVDYVLKKFRGKRVGMFEILPIGKIAAWWRNWRARRSVTKDQQQIRRNINKSEFQ